MSSNLEWKQLAMEPLGFLLMLAYSMSDSVILDFLVYNTCKTRAGLNDSECDLLHRNSSSPEAMRIEKIVEQHVSSILMIQVCIQTIFPSIMSLFLGPWSDKYGRKPLLIFAFIGQATLYVMYAVLSTMSVDPYWYLLPYIPAALLGGFPAILLTIFCYISDVTDKNNRAWHLACIDAMYFTGILLGLFASPYTFKATSYMTIFGLSGAFCIFAVMYTIFCVNETVVNDNRRTFKSIFDVTLVKELFSAVCKKKDGHDRFLIWTAMICMTLHACAMEGNSSVLLLFTRSKLGWDISKYSIYAGTHMLISVVGMLFLVKFAGLISNHSDALVIIISCLSNSTTYIIRAFVSKPWHMYLSSGIGIFNAAAVPAIRSVLSKSISQKDVGKAFSLTITFEMIMPFATTPLFLYVYTKTIDVYPVPVWLMASVLTLIIFLLSVLIEYRLRKNRTPQYTPISSHEGH